MDSLHWDSVIRGHHVYKEIWTPFVGEVLRVEQETHNAQDRFAVAIVQISYTSGINYTVNAIPSYHFQFCFAGIASPAWARIFHSSWCNFTTCSGTCN